MKYQGKNLLFLALAIIGPMVLFTGCGDPATAAGNDTTAADSMETISATLWKKIDIGGDAKVTKIVKSGANTYAQTSDKGLFYKKPDGSWINVDLDTGVQPETTDVKPLKTADGKVELLTAIAGDRVLFVTSKGVGIARAEKTENAWADFQPTAVMDFELKGNKIIWAAVDGKIFIQKADELAKFWKDLSEGEVTGIAQIVKGIDGSIFFGFELGSYQKLDDETIFKPKKDGVWQEGLPTHAIYNGNGLIVDTKGIVAFVPNTDRAGGGIKVLTATVNAFTADKENVLVLAKEGVFTIDKDGKEDKNAKFDGTFKGANYEFKSKEELANMKKADLKAANIGSKDILDIAFAGDDTYYVTADNGVWIGTKADIKVMK